MYNGTPYVPRHDPFIIKYILDHIGIVCKRRYLVLSGTPDWLCNILSGTNCTARFGFRRLSPLEAAVAEAPGPGEALCPVVAALGEPWCTMVA
jgi:hypothetical protein